MIQGFLLGGMSPSSSLLLSLLLGATDVDGVLQLEKYTSQAAAHHQHQLLLVIVIVAMKKRETFLPVRSPVSLATPDSEHSKKQYKYCTTSTSSSRECLKRWEKVFTWLDYDVDCDGAFYKLCKTYGTTSL